MLLARNAGPPFDGGLDRAQAGGVLDEMQSGVYGISSVFFLSLIRPVSREGVAR